MGVMDKGKVEDGDGNGDKDIRQGVCLAAASVSAA